MGFWDKFDKVVELGSNFDWPTESASLFSGKKIVGLPKEYMTQMESALDRAGVSYTRGRIVGDEYLVDVAAEDVDRAMKALSRI